MLMIQLNDLIPNIFFSHISMFIGSYFEITIKSLSLIIHKIIEAFYANLVLLIGSNFSPINFKNLPLSSSNHISIEILHS